MWILTSSKPPIIHETLTPNSPLRQNLKDRFAVQAQTCSEMNSRSEPCRPVCTGYGACRYQTDYEKRGLRAIASDLAFVLFHALWSIFVRTWSEHLNAISALASYPVWDADGPCADNWTAPTFLGKTSGYKSWIKTIKFAEAGAAQTCCIMFIFYGRQTCPHANSTHRK
ncbi:predicted protein [Histoplasma capsulatum G186AR]|uniref:Uncharacterized protein n=1 Tax=Ajellomyces capsulatus (strain G186AR / H82 / ATCC MYA-2454 / RMSCC 2432) TaxID=447093 RepID=C0NKY9_AJECG|nr:uncharacterized protein HCBG_03819 [Histoplasma capsulatum G186AR]EEH08530.1 predicted protein [Histoplasma capsulatum G186AR]